MNEKTSTSIYSFDGIIKLDLLNCMLNKNKYRSANTHTHSMHNIHSINRNMDHGIY